MKLQFLTLCLLIAGLTSKAQTIFSYKDDFKKILEKSKDTSDGLCYARLLTRFEKNDTTLTDFEVLALMIGFTAKPEYKPYKDLEEERAIYKLNGDDKYDDALTKANMFLVIHPLSVKALYEKSYALHKLNQEDSAAFYGYQGRRIFKAMYFSGKGTKKETPTFALGPADGQDYIYKFVGADIGTMGDGKDNEGNFLDILEVKLGDGKSMPLYFIIQHAVEKMFVD